FILLLWVVILNPTSVKVILAKLSARRPPNSKIRALITAFDNFTFKDSIRILGLSFLWIMVIALQYHVLVLAFTDVYFWESLQAVTATLFVKTLLPFTFGDLGIREGIAIFFYSQFQVSSVAVFNASL
ncbi:MAG: hypothetical protein GWN16_13725, partial [Calditrichae bacterium]|nr:hypothetical protein [Calditrichia bacterium]NIV72885.1 hypothetical protein [Calditrichia bacterium]NIW80440.1 hypothetical protein [Calditrichia bacterium]